MNEVEKQEGHSLVTLSAAKNLPNLVKLLHSNGANDYDGNQPETGDKSWDVKNAVMPLVYQCRYSGINSPDDLIESFYINKGIDYYQANLDFDKSTEFLKRADSLIERMIDYINNHP